MSNRRMMVGIEMAMVIAERQGCDVLSATGCRALPDWGLQAATWVLLERRMIPTTSGGREVEYRVTRHIGTDTEFDQGWYFDDRQTAEVAYLERVQRTWLDERIHDEQKRAS